MLPLFPANANGSLLGAFEPGNPGPALAPRPPAPKLPADLPAGTPTEGAPVSIASKAANGSAAAAGSGALLVPLDTRGLNALNGSATGKVPELERAGVADAKSPKPPADALAELPPKASNDEEAPNASKAEAAGVDFTGLPNASKLGGVAEVTGAGALPNASNDEDDARLPVLTGAGAPNASNGVACD